MTLPPTNFSLHQLLLGTSLVTWFALPKHVAPPIHFHFLMMTLSLMIFFFRITNDWDFQWWVGGRRQNAVLHYYILMRNLLLKLFYIWITYLLLCPSVVSWSTPPKRGASLLNSDEKSLAYNVLYLDDLLLGTSVMSWRHQNTVLLYYILMMTRDSASHTISNLSHLLFETSAVSWGAPPKRGAPLWYSHKDSRLCLLS